MIILNREYHPRNGMDLINYVANNGDVQESRIGSTWELMDAVVSVQSDEIIYRPGMSRKLAMVELLQFWTGYFDERHIRKAVPALAYEYGHANAYGQKVSQQLPGLIRQLREFPETRRATLYIGKPEDGFEETKPCMQMLQFQIRYGKLYTSVYARSWDAIHGLPYDVIMINGVAQIMAKLIGVGSGSTTFHAGSLHVYQEPYDHFMEKHHSRKFEIKYNRFEVIQRFNGFTSVREWAHDQLNTIDKWQLGLPIGITSWSVGVL